MALVNEANFDKILNAGTYAPLAGVAKPMLEGVQNVAFSSVSQVQTLVFSGALVASNVVNGVVGGTAIDPVTYITSNAATLTLLAAAIVAANSNVLSAVSDGTNTITVTTKLDVDPTPLTDFVVTLGAGQVTDTITETVAPVSINSLTSGTGIVITAGVATLATDNATHAVVGSYLELVDGTYVIDAIETLNGLVPTVEKGLARIQCRMRAGQVIAIGDDVSFENGLIVKSVSETNKYSAELVDLTENIVQIAFKS